jgi:hypothetical protein
MKYCPRCKQAFGNEVTECPHDKVALVKELPFQAVPADDVTWVEIASTGTEDEAKLLQGFLEAEGIPAQIENTEAHVLPTTFGSLGDIRIYVSAQDEERALRLRQHREKQWEKLGDDDDTLVTDEGVAEVDENASTEPE